MIRKHSFVALCGFVFAALTALPANAQSPGKLVLSKAAPPECVFFLASNGWKEPNPNSTNLTEKLLAEESLKEFFQQFGDELNRVIEKQTAGDEQATVAAGAFGKHQRILQPGVGKIVHDDFRYRLEHLEMVPLRISRQKQYVGFERRESGECAGHFRNQDGGFFRQRETAARPLPDAAQCLDAVGVLHRGSLHDLQPIRPATRAHGMSDARHEKIATRRI